VIKKQYRIWSSSK